MKNKCNHKRIKKNLLIAPGIASLIVITFGILFHYYNVFPHDWNAVALWLSIYISPIWGAFGISYLSERGNNND